MESEKNISTGKWEWQESGRSGVSGGEKWTGRVEREGDKGQALGPHNSISVLTIVSRLAIEEHQLVYQTSEIKDSTE
ncbi:hypothetical protein M0802_015260 [Mischocyttarus mexicanus]|nr:hypothetical protein M0802_015260 [Mischocyttarus mexicanus]